ncbi:FecR domain-containing protein [bacterium]|nr:FecR domain-containing protein [bacterium]
MDQADYQMLISKKLSGELSSKESKQLQDWLTQSPENQALYHEMKRYWEQSRQPEPPFIPDVHQEWSKIKNRLGLDHLHSQSRRPESAVETFRSLLSGRKRLAVAALSLACIFMIAILLWKNEIGFSRYHRMVTGNGERKEITLDDGSQIRMNSGSVVQYAKSWKKKRHVILAGEAFFSVVPGELPFIVQTENAVTGVLGTKFNVRARGRQTRVVVKEGRVRFASRGKASGEVVLAASMMSQIEDHGLPRIPQETDVEATLGWLEKRLVFNETLLREVIAELIRFYDTDIRIEDPELSELTITASFSEMTVDAVLESICLAINAEYIHKKDCYYIVHRCQ